MTRHSQSNFLRLSMEEVVIPLFYVVPPNLTEDQINRVRRALALTPIQAVLITSPHDHKLAMEFSDSIFKVALSDARQVARDAAKEAGLPILLIGERHEDEETLT